MTLTILPSVPLPELRHAIAVGRDAEPQLEGLGLARDLVGDRCRHPPVLSGRIQGSRVPLHARTARVHVGRHVLLGDVVEPRIADAAPGLVPDVSRHHLLHVAVAEHPRGDRRRRRLDRRLGGIEPHPDFHVEGAHQELEPLLPLSRGHRVLQGAFLIASSLGVFVAFSWPAALTARLKTTPARAVIRLKLSSPPPLRLCGIVFPAPRPT